MYYLGIDVGTTAIKGVIVDEAGMLLASESREHRQYFPRPGWVEQDPQELLDSCVYLARTLTHRLGVPLSALQAIGIDHQGETCLVWDKSTGQPVYPAIVWQDRRMAEQTEQYDREKSRRMSQITGLRPDSYYSAWKLRWILDHVPRGQERAERGELLAGTLNTWIIWKLTGGRSFVMDHSTGGCTMLCNVRTGEWDEWILKELRLPQQMLPTMVCSDSPLGKTDPALFDGAAVPITATLTDGSAGTVSAGAGQTGGFISTYGTGSFLHLVTGPAYVEPREGLTASLCLTTKKERLYQLNGICYTAGAAVKWLRDGLGLIGSVAETEALARSVPDTAGVAFVPALNGLATPDWDQSARGAFLGLTAGATRAHLVRAVLESAALQVACCCQLMQGASGMNLTALNAVGGMTSNSFLMQLQADLLGIPVCLPAQTEPAYGTAILAAAAIGHGPGLDALPRINPSVRTYEPAMSKAEREERIQRWRCAVQRCTQWHPTGANHNSINQNANKGERAL